jgi:hypothetical protein
MDKTDWIPRLIDTAGICFICWILFHGCVRFIEATNPDQVEVTDGE